MNHIDRDLAEAIAMLDTCILALEKAASWKTDLSLPEFRNRFRLEMADVLAAAVGMRDRWRQGQ